MFSLANTDRLTSTFRCGPAGVFRCCFADPFDY